MFVFVIFRKGLLTYGNLLLYVLTHFLITHLKKKIAQAKWLVRVKINKDAHVKDDKNRKMENPIIQVKQNYTYANTQKRKQNKHFSRAMVKWLSLSTKRLIELHQKLTRNLENGMQVASLLRIHTLSSSFQNDKN